MVVAERTTLPVLVCARLACILFVRGEVDGLARLAQIALEIWNSIEGAKGARGKGANEKGADWLPELAQSCAPAFQCPCPLPRLRRFQA